LKTKFLSMFVGSTVFVIGSPAIAAQKLLPVSDELIVAFRVLGLLVSGVGGCSLLWFINRYIDLGDALSRDSVLLSGAFMCGGFLCVFATYAILGR
jgi:hypothetical protein